MQGYCGLGWNPNCGIAADVTKGTKEEIDLPENYDVPRRAIAAVEKPVLLTFSGIEFGTSSGTDQFAGKVACLFLKRIFGTEDQDGRGTAFGHPPTSDEGAERTLRNRSLFWSQRAAVREPERGID